MVYAVNYNGTLMIITKGLFCIVVFDKFIGTNFVITRDFITPTR
jgi:hypothetical protein